MRLEPSKHIQLPKDMKEKLEGLRALSEKVKAGDKGAREELRQALVESSPAVIARASDIGRKSQHMLIDTAANGDPLTEYALSGHLDLMRTEISGEDPTPLEALLAERIAAAWILNQVLEVFCSSQLWRGTPKEARTSVSTTKFYLDWQARAHRQLLSSIKTLAQVRKLLKPTVAQINIAEQQVNMASSPTSETSGQVRSRRS